MKANNTCKDIFQSRFVRAFRKHLLFSKSVHKVLCKRCFCLITLYLDLTKSLLRFFTLLWLKMKIKCCHLPIKNNNNCAGGVKIGYLCYIYIYDRRKGPGRARSTCCTILTPGTINQLPGHLGQYFIIKENQNKFEKGKKKKRRKKSRTSLMYDSSSVLRTLWS